MVKTIAVNFKLWLQFKTSRKVKEKSEGEGKGPPTPPQDCYNCRTDNVLRMGTSYKILAGDSTVKLLRPIFFSTTELPMTVPTA